ncbi:hypothetical protein CALVIDRAFT_600285 [Calocera viscosa TUFC12733]|uniref:C2H2-type domain-containing protein n=1 Tax=Calocera viscosa (strain TUFC12733) TaxID=1330018 RepID=A0A167JYB2_CALVF|nr:hypothetical protein CALVIDRAFT_600285 [Calocera viscosa TUFC12733]
MVFVSEHDAFCSICGQDVRSEDRPYSHYIEKHWACFECNGHAFETRDELHEHCEASHPYCKPCKQVFNTQQDLDAHLRLSRIHLRPTYECPMPECHQRFVSRGAVILHLEAGKCASGITRIMIDRLVPMFDLHHDFINPRCIFTAPDGGIELRNSTTFAPPDNAWNGRGLECHLCRREFRYPTQLDQHLASPRHAKTAEKLYHCLNPYCRTAKTTLSGVLQHLETGRCNFNNFGLLDEEMDTLVVTLAGVLRFYGRSQLTPSDASIPLAECFRMIHSHVRDLTEV